MYIIPLSGRDNFLNHYSQTGEIEDNELLIELSSPSSDDSDLIYSAIKDTGAIKIPVYVTEATYKVGKAIGVLN